MDNFNYLIMALISGFLLWLVSIITMDPLINLGLNCLLLVLIVIYIMQFLGVMKELLPAIKIFKS